MNRKLIIVRIESTIWTCIYENDTLVELHCANSNVLLGNIYIGRVKNIVSNIQAAFIEIAGGLECYYSITDNPAPIFTKKDQEASRTARKRSTCLSSWSYKLPKNGNKLL